MFDLSVDYTLPTGSIAYRTFDMVVMFNQLAMEMNLNHLVFSGSQILTDLVFDQVIEILTQNGYILLGSSVSLSYINPGRGDAVLYSHQSGREIDVVVKLNISFVDGNPPEVNLHIAATTPQLAEATYINIKELIPPSQPVPDNTVMYKFHFLGSNGPVSRNKRVVTVPREKLVNNYANSVAQKLDDLYDLQLDNNYEGGKLLLLYGEPGTGKSHAIRTLSSVWKSWTDFNYIIDPQQFFQDAEYMTQVIMGDMGEDILMEDDESYSAKWSVYVIEDSDEFIAKDAKSRSGQGLSLLLNLTDGILGQGLKNLFIITTNEPVTNLHSAVVRPGRCLANIDFQKLSAQEAKRWAEYHEIPHLVGSREYTLAELYELQSQSQINTAANQAVGTGMYL